MYNSVFGFIHEKNKPREWGVRGIKKNEEVCQSVGWINYKFLELWEEKRNFKLVLGKICECGVCRSRTEAFWCIKAIT